MKRMVCSVFLIILVSSCNNPEQINKNSNKPDINAPFLFNMQHFFTQSENLMSFPFWFLQSEVAKSKLFRISRNIYHISLNASSGSGREAPELREVRDYFFNRGGKIDSVRIDFYYDRQKISEVSFCYSGESDQYGYYRSVQKTVRMPDTGGLTYSELPFVLLDRKGESRKHLSFKDETKGLVFHYMLNEKDFGPLSVDSVLSPGPNDLVILGTPFKPHKQYQVKNKVHERNVQLYSYQNNGDMLHTFTRNEYPFDITRTIQYDKKGNCTGYIDSTFSGKTFLTATQSKFTFNSRNLPAKLERLNKHQQGAHHIVSIEKYTYEYYQDQP
jgi:hypothetical protein